MKGGYGWKKKKAVKKLLNETGKMLKHLFMEATKKKK